MHEYLKQAREGAERKLKGIQKGEPHTKVDSSSWSPPDMLEADKQNGMRPVSKRQYKSGGKVEGAHAKKRADRKARKEGGRAMSVDGFINRDNKLANDEREGVKKIGGMKRGGKIKREHHADGDAVGDLIRQDQIEQGMKGRGLPMRVPMPPRRPKASAPSFKDPIPNSASPTYKKGGAAHPDVAEDKALIRKMVKPSARTGKAEGGSKFDSPTHSFKMKLSNGEDTTTHNLSMPGESAANALVNAVKFANKGGWNVDNIEHTGSSAGAGSSAGLMKRGGRAMKYGGGGIFSGDSKKKVPGDVGGRQARASGGGFGEAFKAARAAMLEGGPKTFEFNGKQYSTDLAKATPSGGSRNVGMGKADAARAARAMRSENTRDYGQERAAASRSAMAADPEMQSIVNRTPGDFNVGPTRANEPKAVVGNILRNQMKPTGEEPLSFGYATDDANYPKGSAQNQANMERSSSVVPENEFPGYPGSRKAGGRTHHAKGGRTKGKTNINIIIGAGHSQKPPMPMGMGEMPNAPVSPRTPPAAGMPPQGMPPMGPQGAPPMPPQGGMPMPRKHGGRTGYPIETGAGGGEARLDKIKAYGLTPPKRK